MGWSLSRIAIFFGIIALAFSGLFFLLSSFQPEVEERIGSVTTAVPTRTQSANSTAAMPAENVVAIVNGRSLDDTALQLTLAADQTMATLAKRPFAPDPALLQRLINTELVVQAAAAHNFTVTAADVDAALQSLLAANGRSPADLAAALAQHDTDLASFKSILARLVQVEQFTRAQSSALGITPDDFVRRLQADARISLGPAAQLAQAAPPTPPPPTPTTAVATPQPSPTTAVAETAVIEASAIITTAPTTANTAPNFTLPLLTGSDSSAALSLADLRGKPVVLSFWTTWCPYCRAQTPVLIDAYERYGADVTFIGINVREEQSTVANYITESQIPYQILLDTVGTTADAYHVNGFPTTYFLDAAGQIVTQHVGQLSTTDIDRLLGQIRAAP